MLNKCARVLVERGYGKDTTCMCYEDSEWYKITVACEPPDAPNWETVDPFTESLEGRKQLDAIEDWLHQNHEELINAAKLFVTSPKPYNGRQKRLDRIKYCMENLEFPRNATAEGVFIT